MYICLSTLINPLVPDAHNSEHTDKQGSLQFKPKMAPKLFFKINQFIIFKALSVSALVGTSCRSRLNPFAPRLQK